SPGRAHGKRRAVAGRLAQRLRTGHPPDPRLPGRAEPGRAEGADPPGARRRAGRGPLRGGPTSMIEAYQARCQARVDAALESLFDAPQAELARLYQAMRYS